MRFKDTRAQPTAGRPGEPITVGDVTPYAKKNCRQCGGTGQRMWKICGCALNRFVQNRRMEVILKKDHMVWAQAAEPAVPYPQMQLNCPSCAWKHIDRDEWATRPHHKHLCEHCGRCSSRASRQPPRTRRRQTGNNTSSCAPRWPQTSQRWFPKQLQQTPKRRASLEEDKRQWAGR